MILAFLQNMWVRDPERVRRAIERDGESFRVYFMRFALFRGCKTGRMLKKAFGEELIEKIEFEETTRQIAGNPREIFPADLEHIRKALELHKPTIVLAFGEIAHKAVQPLWQGKYIHAHHPASRAAGSWENLLSAAKQLREMEAETNQKNNVQEIRGIW